MPDAHESIFVDSNIWLYALLKQGADKTAKAKAIIHRPAVIVSTQVINEICDKPHLKGKEILNGMEIQPYIQRNRGATSRPLILQKEKKALPVSPVAGISLTRSASDVQVCAVTQ